MDIDVILRRTAYEAGASEDLADRIVERFLHEVQTALRGGATVALGDFGTFHGTAFTPGRDLAPAGASAFADTEGYEEARVPKDS